MRVKPRCVPPWTIGVRLLSLGLTVAFLAAMLLAGPNAPGTAADRSFAEMGGPELLLALVVASGVGWILRKKGSEWLERAIANSSETHRVSSGNAEAHGIGVEVPPQGRFYRVGGLDVSEHEAESASRKPTASVANGHIRSL